MPPRSRYRSSCQALRRSPLVRILHATAAKIGVLTASSTALTQAHFDSTGTRMEEVFIKGMEGYPEFWETIIEGKRHDFDLERLEEEICSAATTLAQENDLDALVLECTELSAFSLSIQTRTGLPVYDINALTEYVYSAVQRKRYE